jgi:DNA-binding response OmpR family regulator
MRILLIEGDAASAEQIRAELQRAHFAVDLAADGDTGLRRSRQIAYALLIVDAALPGRDGLSVCQAVRGRRDAVPILMLTARSGSEDRVRALESGADDSLPKPFSPLELVARVRALLRRDRLSRGSVIRIADLEIDPEGLRVRRAGQEIFLTPGGSPCWRGWPPTRAGYSPAK